MGAELGNTTMIFVTYSRATVCLNLIIEMPYVHGLSQKRQCICYALGVQSIVINNGNYCSIHHTDMVFIPFLGPPSISRGVA